MSRTRISETEAGFTLASLIVILTIVAIIIAYTVPEQWSMVMARERDRQTIFLMKQYARAIRAWSRKHNGMPTSLDQLADARRPRFLRGTGKWPMPVTGREDDWILVPPGAIEAVQNPGPIQNTRNPNTQTPNTQNPNNQTPGQTTKLRPDASPKDYVGPFIGVRPNAKGKSFIAFKGAEDYSEWVYTVQDLELEIQLRAQSLQTN
jgi:type II secretory pathway pseudopilin PulG